LAGFIFGQWTASSKAQLESRIPTTGGELGRAAQKG
jgi:hypothetical protein